jgi:hypothetical protein
MIVPLLPNKIIFFMRRTIILLLFVNSMTFVQAQNYVTRTAHINIKSANKVQNIVADNFQAACQLNAQTGQFKLIALIKSFEYQIGLLNRVMNTRNIDVTEFPKITFNGKIENIKQLDFSKPGSYPVKIKGVLYIWDENRITTVDGVLSVLNDGSIEGKSNFTIAIEEVNTEKIDMIMRQKLPISLNLQSNTMGISKNIEVKTELILKKQ